MGGGGRAGGSHGRQRERATASRGGRERAAAGVHIAASAKAHYTYHQASQARMSTWDNSSALTDPSVLAAKQADRYQRLLRALRVKFTSVRDIRKGRQAGGAADQ